MCLFKSSNQNKPCTGTILKSVRDKPLTIRPSGASVSLREARWKDAKIIWTWTWPHRNSHQVAVLAKREVHRDAPEEEDVYCDSVNNGNAGVISCVNGMSIIIACTNVRSTVTWPDIWIQSVGGGVIRLWESLARCQTKKKTTNGVLSKKRQFLSLMLVTGWVILVIENFQL